MLDLTVAMFLRMGFPALLMLVSMLFFSGGSRLFRWNGSILFTPWSAQEAQEQLVIHSPGGGEALQGVVTISGTTDIPGFRSAEVAFAYQNDPTNTWFLIQQSNQPVLEGILAVWDTTTIADGTYKLRLQVILIDGQVEEHVVAGLRVRNYSRIETSTPPSPAATQPTITPTPTPLPDFQVVLKTQPPEPTNPAQINMDDVQRSALGGTLAVFTALLVGALYLAIRALFRR